MKQHKEFGWQNYLENNCDLKMICDLILPLNKHSKLFESEIKKFKINIDFREERDEIFKEIYDKSNDFLKRKNYRMVNTVRSFSYINQEGKDREESFFKHFTQCKI